MLETIRIRFHQVICTTWWFIIGTTYYGIMTDWFIWFFVHLAKAQDGGV
jgi:hypothetical protein